MDGTPGKLTDTGPPKSPPHAALDAVGDLKVWPSGQEPSGDQRKRHDGPESCQCRPGALRERSREYAYRGADPQDGRADLRALARHIHPTGSLRRDTPLSFCD